MKRLPLTALLAGCAAALAAVAAPAAAQSTFDMAIGGDAYFEAGYLRQSGEAGQTRATEFANRFRLVITPTAKADNGLEYGARLRLRANGGNAVADTDRAFLFAQGAFGRVEAGQNDGPNNALYVTAPANFGTGGVDGDWSAGNCWINCVVFAQTNFGWNGPGGGAVFGATTATKVNYFTPRLGGSDPEKGLQAALSYATVVDADGTNSQNTSVARQKWLGAPGSANPSYDDVHEIGLRYDEEFGGVTVAASAGTIGGRSKLDTAGGRYHDLRAWQAGLQLGYAGVLVGAGYLDAGKSGYSRNTATDPFAAGQRTWTVGASYAWDDFVVGANYLDGRDAGDTTAAGASTLRMVAVGATWVPAPGLDLGLEYVHSRAAFEPGSANRAALGAHQDANLFLLRANLTF